LLKMLKAFVVATAACWCICCLISISSLFGICRRKSQDYKEFGEAEEENEEGSDEDGTGTVGTNGSRVESRAGSLESGSGSEEDEDLESSTSARSTR
jgi:hypothetical protein